MKVTYCGPHRAVDIAIPGGSVHAEHGAEVDVPESVAKSLLEQGTFTAVKAKSQETK